MAQSNREKKSSGHDVDFVSQKRLGLNEEDSQANSGPKEHLPDNVIVKDTEAKQDRSQDNCLEDGLGILFVESQSSKEVSIEQTERSKQAKARVDTDKGMKSDAEDGPSKSKKKKKHVTKIAPDHFIALQISNPEIQKGFADVQEKIVSQNPPLIDAMVSTRKLHVTVMAVCLPTQDHIDRAKSALDVCAARLCTDYGDRLVVLGVTGIGHFRNNVLFAKVTPSDSSQHNILEHISDVVNDSFAEHGIKNTDQKSHFKPHVTIAKLSKNFHKLRKKGIKKIDPSLYADQVDRYFGHQVLTTVQLCSMFKKDEVTGYYKKLHEASFGPRKISNLTIEKQFTFTSAADILVQWSVQSAVDRCIATSPAAGDETNSIKSEESRHLRLETECLTDPCDDEHVTVHKVKLDPDSDPCTVSVNATTVTLDSDSEINQVDSVSKVDSVLAANSEVESVLRCSSDVKVCSDDKSKKSYIENEENSASP